MDDKIRVVYSPKTDQERRRRCARMDALVGTPFVRMPGDVPEHKVLFITKFGGQKIRRATVEMVFNDALLSDAVSNWGEDGPLYADTLDNDAHREVWDYAVRLYAGVELPEKYKNPRKPS